MSHKDTIRRFCKAWSRLDASELADFFTEDGTYYNMPTQPVIGRANVEVFIRNFLSTWTATDWEIINLVEEGDTVYCERLDRTQTIKGNVDLPCFGVFEMADGKIRLWRDYFDLGTYMRAMD